ncbi:MAG: ribonuclease H-like domain-containing protein [Candidatus Sumerlaeia bacterium]|nr:ribonuclease H-like domain-containing protein [Candidatus Sumerlaeia bacterium]
MNLYRRLDQIAQRKARQQVAIEDLRAGHHPGIATATNHFSRPQSTPPPRARAILDHLDATTAEEGPQGRVYIRRVELRPGCDNNQPHALGAFGPAGSPPLTHDQLADLSTEWEGGPVEPHQIGFMDTETTGLAGGTGTIAFLVGIGWWEARPDGWVFVLEQFLVDDFAHEGELMRRVGEHFARFRIVVSYNGRCFDMPLLRTRGIMNRLPPRLFRPAQVDLLTTARRLWRNRLESVSLKSVESHLMCIDRGPDVDGAEIPAIFFDLAHNGTIGRLPLVVSHNAQDIATMAGLLYRLGLAVGDPHGCGLLDHWSEFAGIARWRETQRRWDEAAAAWTRALSLTGSDESVERELLYRLAACHKRQRHWTPAVEAWEALSQQPVIHSAIAWIELAKYHEHVARNPVRALEVVRECLGKIRLEEEIRFYLGRDTTRAPSPLMADMLHRENRLSGKIDRLGERPRV